MSPGPSRRRVARRLACFVFTCVLGLVLPVCTGSAFGSTFWCGDVVARVAFGCAASQGFPATEFEPALRPLLAKARVAGEVVWGDRAFAVDLNGDNLPEYFVPVGCNATGFCEWAVLGREPLQLMAQFGADIVYIHALQEGDRWSVLTTYTRNGAGQGRVEQFGRGKHDSSFQVFNAQEITSWIVNDAFLAAMGADLCGK